MFVNPFQRKSDNVLESFSLGTHVVLCGLTLIKALYYGEDYYSFSNRLPVLNVIENIFILAPLSVIMIIVVVSIAIGICFKSVCISYNSKSKKASKVVVCVSLHIPWIYLIYKYSKCMTVYLMSMLLKHVNGYYSCLGVR
jgi:hypothetical protein